MRADIIDAEVVEDFNVEDVFKPQVVHEVEVYAGPDDTAARTNLRQAGEIEKSAQWAKARLIACSAQRGAGHGGSRSSASRDALAKLGIRPASKEMGVSDKTVAAYLDAWNAAAADGLCAPSTDLTPADGWTAEMPDPEDWAHYWGGNSHSTPAPVFGERGGPTIPHMNDWPEVPEPDGYTEPTPEEKVQRFEETRQRLIDQGLIPRPRTKEEDDAAAERFVQSLTGQASPRPRAPETPETKLKTLLNEISKLLTEGAALDDLDGLTEAGREAYAKLTKGI